jgi:hypothetical protein
MPAKRKKQAARFPGGSAPFGYVIKQAGGAAVLVEHPKRKPAIEAMRALRLDGKSYRRIAEHVAEAYGLTISHEGVRRLIAA